MRVTDHQQDFCGGDRTGDWGPAVFVWSIWLLMLGLALFFIVKHGRNVPYVDDWSMVPYVTGNAPVTLTYLWEQHNEHRIPLPKIVLLTLYRLTGGNFMSGMAFNGVALGVIALALILGSRIVQGRTRYTDAVLPLMMLHWGHCEDLLWSWEICFTIPALLLCGAFLVVYVRGNTLTPGAILILGLCLVLLPLSTAIGLPFVVLLSLWLACAGLRELKSSSRRTGLSMLLFSMAALAVTGLLFVNIKNNPSDYFITPNPTLADISRTIGEILSMTFGPGILIEPAYEYLLYSWIGVLVFLISGALLLGSIAIHRPEERMRALGLLAFLAGVGGLAVAVGKARAGPYLGQGLQYRYSLMMVPALYSVYIIWNLYGSLRLGRFVRISLFSAVCSFLLMNGTEGMIYANRRQKWNNDFLKEIEDGSAFYRLVQRYHRPLGYELDQDSFAELLRMLYRAGIEPFNNLRGNHTFDYVPFVSEPVHLSMGRWENGLFVIMGNQSFLEYHISQPRFICGMRFKVQYYYDANPQSGGVGESELADGASPVQLPWTRKGELINGNLPRWQVSWKNTDQGDFVDKVWGEHQWDRWQADRFMSSGSQEQTVTIWMGGTVDRFRVYPDIPLQNTAGRANRARAVAIKEIALIVPTSAGLAPHP